MSDIHTTLLDDDVLYDLIVDAVGDDTSHEFCALADYYLEDESLTAVTRIHAVDVEDLDPLIHTIQQKARNRSEER